MVRLLLRTIALFFLIGIAALNMVSAASIKVTLERDVVSLNDSFIIFFQTAGSVDGEPDFSPLEKDFSILSRNHRSNLSLINGKRSSNNEWLIEVQAKRDGVLKIPAIKFANDRSPTIEVTVKNGSVTPQLKQPGQQGQDNSDEEIFIEVEASPETSWVQAQVIYTIRLFRSVNTFNSSLSEPEISGGKMISEKLEDRQYEVSRNNKLYIVLQRRYALFPQASGKFTIEPIVFKGQISQQSRHLFDPFGRNSLAVQKLSRGINLTIKAVPGDYTGKTWLPARNLQIHEKWMKDNLELVAGEPVTRTFVIKADGLTSEQLPEVGVTNNDDFKVYPDQPEMHNQTSSDGVMGIRQEKNAVIPKKAGEYVLPAVEMTWWNTQTGEMELAQLPERVINVLPRSGEKLSDQPDQKEQMMGNESISEESLTKSVELKQAQNYWPWVSLVLAFGWVATLVFGWKQNKTKDNTREKEPQGHLNQRSTLRTLRKVIKSDDSVQIKDALLIWAKSVWVENPPISLADLGERCGQPLKDELVLLNRDLYASSNKQWDNERLLLAIENFDGSKRKQEDLVIDGLVPLNKI